MVYNDESLRKHIKEGGRGNWIDKLLTLNTAFEL